MLSQQGEHFRDLDAVANAWFGRARAALLALDPDEIAGKPAPERVEIALMRWLDALAAGGAGAAALLVFQGLFGEQIARITRYHYAVTGSWDEPTVDLLGANDGQVSMEAPTSQPEG